MPNIVVQLPLGLTLSAFALAGVRQPDPARFVFTPKSGHHEFRSEELLLGLLPDGGRVLGSFRFAYENEVETGDVSLYGSSRAPSSMWIDASLDLPSAQRFVTVSDSVTPPLSGPDAPLVGALREVAALARRSLMTAIDAVPGMAAWTPLFAPGEPRPDVFIVYRNGRLFDVYDPSRPYGPTYRVVHIDTTGVSRGWVGAGRDLRNVIGSARDPKPSKTSWIGLWRTSFVNNPLPIHGLRNAPNPRCASTGLPFQNGVPFACSPGIVGGHVVRASQAQRQQPGSAAVMLMPICGRHNVKPGVLLTTRVRTPVLKLQGYLQ